MRKLRSIAISLLLLLNILTPTALSSDCKKKEDDNVYDSLLADFARYITLSLLKEKYLLYRYCLIIRWKVLSDPEGASLFKGKHGYDDQLARISLNSADWARGECGSFVRRADRLLEAWPPIVTGIKVMVSLLLLMLLLLRLLLLFFLLILMLVLLLLLLLFLFCCCCFAAAALLLLLLFCLSLLLLAYSYC